MPKNSVLWGELEREAHRVVRELVDSHRPVDDPEAIASRILFARSDASPSVRDAYLELLANVIRRYAELLQAKP